MYPYYRRLVNMELNFPEEPMLDNILEAFTTGFRDEYITKKTIQGLGDRHRSVLNAYNLAKSV